MAVIGFDETTLKIVLAGDRNDERTPGLEMLLDMIDHDSVRLINLSNPVRNKIREDIRRNNIGYGDLEWLLGGWKSSNLLMNNVFTAFTSQALAVDQWQRWRENGSMEHSLIASNIQTDGVGIGLMNKVDSSVGDIAIQAMFDHTQEQLDRVLGAIKDHFKPTTVDPDEYILRDKVALIFNSYNNCGTSRSQEGALISLQARDGGDEGIIMLAVDESKIGTLRLTPEDRRIIAKFFELLSVKIVVNVNKQYKAKGLRLPIHTEFLDVYINTHQCADKSRDELISEWWSKVRYIAPKLRQDSISKDLEIRVDELGFDGLLELSEELVKQNRLVSKLGSGAALTYVDNIKLQLIEEYISNNQGNIRQDLPTLEELETQLDNLISITRTYFLLERGKNVSESDIVEYILGVLPKIGDDRDSGSFEFQYMRYHEKQLNKTESVLPYILGVELDPEARTKLQAKLYSMILETNPECYDKLLRVPGIFSSFFDVEKILRLLGATILDPVTRSINTPRFQIESALAGEQGRILCAFVVKSRTKIKNSFNPAGGDEQIWVANEYYRKLLEHIVNNSASDDFGIPYDNAEFMVFLCEFSQSARMCFTEEKCGELSETVEHRFEISTLISSVLSYVLLQGRRGADNFAIITEESKQKVLRVFKKLIADTECNATYMKQFEQIVDRVIQKYTQEITRDSALSEETVYYTDRTYSIDGKKYITKRIRNTFPLVIEPLVLEKNGVILSKPDLIATDKNVEEGLSERWIRHFLAYMHTDVDFAGEVIQEKRKSSSPRMSPRAISSMLIHTRVLKNLLTKATIDKEKVVYIPHPPCNDFEYVLSELLVFATNTRGYKYTKLVSTMTMNYLDRLAWNKGLATLKKTRNSQDIKLRLRRLIESGENDPWSTNERLGVIRSISTDALLAFLKRNRAINELSLIERYCYKTDVNDENYREGGYNIEFFLGAPKKLVEALVSTMDEGDKIDFLIAMTAAEKIFKKLQTNLEDLSRAASKYLEMLIDLQLGEVAE